MNVFGGTKKHCSFPRVYVAWQWAKSGNRHTDGTDILRTNEVHNRRPVLIGGHFSSFKLIEKSWRVINPLKTAVQIKQDSNNMIFFNPIADSGLYYSDCINLKCKSLILKLKKFEGLYLKKKKF